MEFKLKPLSSEAIPSALERAHRYRLLNEPWQAESICEDILQVDPKNQSALTTLLLAITDQFGVHVSATRAREVLSAMDGEYERVYYAGIIFERSARARMRQAAPGAGFRAYEDFVNAMRSYEMAEQLRPTGNDEALLRWNTCARTLTSHHDLRPEPEENLTPVLDD
jgi:hypothetical protein